ncbi:HD-GYP domain-containing protein [Wenzhouxiangella sp. AB-CW3]|uniref:HD-GYP domain-containing protein n=1 Tax=Wenzhouxiangella sp. AB-CW3 TaxID=2771012 RepID=UPI00168BB96D|nr:HD-GYP domain-containing protein [Wenzhouxiangella sp. AB-CW3]QOC21463.1 HD-GYP domain-containing protein [Wenzhouxiangella sp. AB-CW3]
MSSEQPRWMVESRIDPNDLRIGHFVTRLDIPWRETRFPLEGVLIDSPEIKAWMVANCSWVVVSHVRGPEADLQLPPGEIGGADAEKPSGPPRKTLTGEISAKSLRQALETRGSLERQVRDLIDQFKQRGRVDIAEAQTVARELAEVLEHNLAALVWLTRIKDRDDYTAQHCINVSILAMGLAHALDWEGFELECAGLSGLLHDLGKIHVDQTVLKKEGRLTEAEFAEVKRHAELGYKMLKGEGGLPDSVLEAVLSHHERPDGSGYPRGLSAKSIPPMARLVSIVDAYDAITSHRVYDPARSHHEALGILWKQRGRQFDAEMVEAFNQIMGWVTPGTLVRLTDERLAVVLQAKDGRGLLPMVRLLESGEKGYRLADRLDLAAEARSRGAAALRIAQVLPDGAEGVDIRDLAINF